MNNQLTNYERANISNTCFVYNLISFICSFIALFIAFLPFVNFIAIVLAGLALTFSILSYKKSSKINKSLTSSLFAIIVSLIPLTIAIGINVVLVLALVR